MQLSGRKRATAVAVAVVGGLLGGAAVGPPTALADPSPAAPAAPGTDPATGTTPAQGTPQGASPAAGLATGPAADPIAAPQGPPVWPRPQSLTADRSREVPLGSEAVLVVPLTGADPHAVEVIRTALRAAGVTTLREQHPYVPLPARGTVFRIQGADAEAALQALGAGTSEDLPAGGYRLAVGRDGGRDTVALAGFGEDGLFHGAQTLRQLLAGARGKVPGAVVRDWPAAPVRGITEGFYGEPWTLEQRLAQLDFMGRTKQNRFLLAPGDDVFRQARWREDYPEAQREEFRRLAERAAANRVTLGWAVAPGQSMCLSSAADRKALQRKLEAMWELGFRSFQLQFQDVSYTEWGCSADRQRYGKGPAAAARAHAEVAGELAAGLAREHPGAAPLSLMPTEYYQEGATAYRTALATALDGRVEVAWTGVGVLPRTITGRELAAARTAFGHPLVTMDNYPVNDWEPGRIYLGAYTGREAAVANGSAGLLAHAAQQGTLSRIPLFTAADFAWNPRGYRPGASWEAAVAELAGGDARVREALAALAGNTASSALGQPESAYLQPLMDEFWRARGTGDRAALDRAADRLRAAFTVMREARGRLGEELGREAGPWLDRLAQYGTAGELAVDTLRAQARGEGAAAWRAYLALGQARTATAGPGATVGQGVLDPFLTKVTAEADAWTGAALPAAGPVSRESGSWTLRLDRARPVSAVTVMTDPLTPAVRGASVEAHIPGEGWRKLGEAAGSGWTQAEATGLTADAVRLVWAGEAPAVRALVPWFADGPQARFELGDGGRADAEIGGRPQRVAAELSPLRPGEVRGSLSAKPPQGIKVEVPAQTTVPRGTAVAVPVEVTVPEGTPAGVYEVPVSFGGESRTLTVRAFPRTGGPDLAKTATASSSGDETPDFPASAAVDGRADTRWSSPAEDGAWWQAELAAPVRLGQLVLHWQDAYPTEYRVETSADGTTWRTAATVADARGGRASVRMDAPDTRFVRLVCDVRATEYGCSLWSAEAYAVIP
ncbi:hyaluronidase [Streptomyces venezuelae]|uniref:Hyaluronidase n=1 Tax=Streptomyces venezuelae TaxID=54571 RepID=A0A5P2D7V0_STRVZ|nr:beta-N-acetylglucosaminidase domain-containing protein [Streptomyces venezuelae]QES50138.1 hyaluronidase [Streptomyces venezuelae]